MKVTRIYSHCEFQPMRDGSTYEIYFIFEDGSKVKAEGFTQWSAELFEKLGVGTEEEKAIIIGFHRYLERFTPEIAREYVKLDKEHWLSNEDKSIPPGIKNVT